MEHQSTDGASCVSMGKLLRPREPCNGPFGTCPYAKSAVSQPCRSSAVSQDGDKRSEFGTRCGLARGRASPLGQGYHHDYYEAFAKTAGTCGLASAITGQAIIADPEDGQWPGYWPPFESPDKAEATEKPALRASWRSPYVDSLPRWLWRSQRINSMQGYRPLAQ
jgi:hypothetical protein